MNLDYETLKLLCWALLVLAVIGFMVCDGITLGIAMLLPLIGKTEADRQNLIASIAPTSLGQQAWLVAAIALLFAAWPIAYAVFFSSFQAVLFLMLLTWLARPLAWYFRSANENPSWIQNWDKALVVSGLVPSIMLGIICGNLLKGVPFHLDSDMRIFFLGDFWALLNPFALLVAATTVSLLLMYGAAYLQLKHSAEIYRLSKSMIFKSGAAFLILFALTGLWITRLEGYHVTSEIIPNGVANPLAKFVKRSEGLWLDNFEHEPGLWAIPVLVFIGGGATLILSKMNRQVWSFIASSVTVGMSVLTAAISIFPFLLPSNRSLNSSLTIWDASASQNTLGVAMWVAAIALPLLAIASRWAFWLWKDNAYPNRHMNPSETLETTNHDLEDDYA